MMQTLGVNNPRWMLWFKRAATVFATVIFLGFIAVPIGVLTGVVK
jgi:hypothetical protein